jgi:hypothetical protein
MSSFQYDQQQSQTWYKESNNLSSWDSNKLIIVQAKLCLNINTLTSHGLKKTICVLYHCSQSKTILPSKVVLILIWLLRLHTPS